MSNNQQPLDLDSDATDEKTIDYLFDLAKRGYVRGNQRPPSICKVSRILRDHSERSYEPLLVSIGPIHSKNEKLQEFERLKECYLADLLLRCHDSTLEAFLLKVNTLLPQIKESYAGMIENYSDNKLASMMVLDGCFILEFCFKHEEENLLPNKMQRTGIAMDLMLLENQVPFFVLQALFECSMGKHSFTLSDVLDKYLVPYSKLFRSDLLPEKNSILSNILDKYLAPYIKRFCSLLPEKLPTTDVEHSDLPEKNSPTDVDLPEKNSTTDVDHSDLSEKFSTIDVDTDLREKISTTDVVSDSTPDHLLGYLHKHYLLVAAKSETIVPGPKQLCSSLCIIIRKCIWSNCVLAPSLHVEASKPVDEELAAKSSNPTDVETSKPVDEELAAKSSNPTDAESSKPVDEELAAKSSNPTDAKEDTPFHSIVELDRSGMNFKPHQEDEWSMTIKFHSSHFACLPFFWKPTLLMPTLAIDDTTELILRNFIAYEQSFPQVRCYFTSYAHAMDKLIDSQEDIAKLVKAKVLVNDLGSNQEAADMINKVCKNIYISDFRYTKEFKQMDKYYNRFLPKNIAMLKRVYFSNPWSAIALVAAIIVSLATVVATIFAVLDYFR